MVAVGVGVGVVVAVAVAVGVGVGVVVVVVVAVAMIVADLRKLLVGVDDKREIMVRTLGASEWVCDVVGTPFLAEPDVPGYFTITAAGMRLVPKTATVPDEPESGVKMKPPKPTLESMVDEGTTITNE